MMTETMTHAGARGSNDLIGRNVVQTMTFVTPDEYERLQALKCLDRALRPCGASERRFGDGWPGLATWSLRPDEGMRPDHLSSESDD